jgi:lipopolysaccharide biosynthesis protein
MCQHEKIPKENIIRTTESITNVWQICSFNSAVQVHEPSLFTLPYPITYVLKQDESHNCILTGSNMQLYAIYKLIIT